jgi:hypothetical protein
MLTSFWITEMSLLLTIFKYHKKRELYDGEPKPGNVHTEFPPTRI